MEKQCVKRKPRTHSETEEEQNTFSKDNLNFIKEQTKLNARSTKLNVASRDRQEAAKV